MTFVESGAGGVLSVECSECGARFGPGPVVLPSEPTAREQVEAWKLGHRCDGADDG